MRFVHRVHSDAPVADVWRLVEDPRRWPEFDVFVARVTGAPAEVRAGQRLLGVGRGLPVRMPIDVRDVQPGRRLSIVVHTAPGVRDEITIELVPAVRGGTDIRLTTMVDGVFAGLAFLPAWVAAGLRIRLLARRAGSVRGPGSAGRRSGAA